MILPDFALLGEALSERDRKLLDYVLAKGGEVPLAEFSDRIYDIQKLISLGYLKLKIAFYQWGIEYLVTATSVFSKNRDYGTLNNGLI